MVSRSLLHTDTNRWNPALGASQCHGRGFIGGSLETRDLAAAHPEIVARIEEIMAAARTDVPEYPIRELASTE